MMANARIVHSMERLVVAFAGVIDYVAMNYRPLAMTLVVLPLSFLLRYYLLVQTWLLTRVYASSRASHEEKVARIAAEVIARAALPPDQQKPMCTAREPWRNLSTRFADYKKDSNCIYIGDCDSILSLDEDQLTVTIEPLVEVGTITHYLAERGFMLATTLEIEEATIGGLAMAVGMTTASHKYGLLQETVREYEVVLADGQVMRVTPSDDLYYSLPWSHGSLALLVGLTLDIIRIKPYVKVTYTPVNGSQTQYCDLIRELALRTDNSVPDFVEATIFSRDSAVVMDASFCDRADEPRLSVNHVTRWYQPWFYTHIRSMLQRTHAHSELVPTTEYIFRHNRAIFWTLRDQLPEHIGNHPLYRLLLGWMCPPKVTFLKLPSTPRIRKEMMTERVYQDIVLPVSAMEESINLAADQFEIWPILVYPSRIYSHTPAGLFPQPRPDDMVPGTKYAMYFDLGVYGIPKAVREGRPYRAVSCMRTMERFTSSVNGVPFLYADTFMTLEEFANMVNLDHYEAMRKKYGAENAFHHVYTKIAHKQTIQELREEEEKECGRCE